MKKNPFFLGNGSCNKTTVPANLILATNSGTIDDKSKVSLLISLLTDVSSRLDEKFLCNYLIVYIFIQLVEKENKKTIMVLEVPVLEAKESLLEKKFITAPQDFNTKSIQSNEVTQLDHLDTEKLQLQNKESAQVCHLNVIYVLRIVMLDIL